MNGFAALTVECRIEEELWGLDSDGTWDSDLRLIWELVLLVFCGAVFAFFHFLFVVESNVAELLLDILDDFLFGRGGEVVTSTLEEPRAVVVDGSTGDLHLLDG